ncbi:hypothetical protein NL676_037257 [Syzygium grande]|nr:hypothetical protein NL676_037257 [Syzygium grande]
MSTESGSRRPEEEKKKMGELRRRRDRQWITQRGGEEVCGPVAFCVNTGRRGRAMPGKRHAPSYERRGSSLRGERKSLEREMLWAATRREEVEEEAFD